MSVDITEKFGKEMDATIKVICTPGKGILAADESTGTIGKRFQSINVENIEENRRAYRELLFKTAKESNKYIGGVILFDETLFQKDKDGTPFVKLLSDNGIIPGIKVDEGQIPLYNTNDTVTQGITKLDARCQKYYKQGARFAKWRAAIPVTASELAIRENARLLAHYAQICQANGLVPIVEPEVLVLDGAHDIETSFRVTEKVLSYTFFELVNFGVVLERILLKPNMVMAGSKHPKKSSIKEIAEYTIKCLKRTVPTAVPGIVFLSGGMSEEEAAEALNEINIQIGEKKPWYLSFSYGRALQQSALKAWSGKNDETNISEAQKAFLKRAKDCSLATMGKLNK